MKYLSFLHGVVNQNWAVHQLAYLGTLANDAAHPRKTRQQVQVVEQGTSETGCRFSVILGNATDDFSEIV
jgi:hypothetical protein